MDEIILNGHVVDHRLSRLINRDDWSGKRTSKNWLEKFPKLSRQPKTPFIDFCSLEQMVFENQSIRKPDLKILWGEKNYEYSPGDFNPAQGYLIGFTEVCDDGIFVDVRDKENPIITYTVGYTETLIATAFTSLDDFVSFYLSQHQI